MINHTSAQHETKQKRKIGRKAYLVNSTIVITAKKFPMRIQCAVKNEINKVYSKIVYVLHFEGEYRVSSKRVANPAQGRTNCYVWKSITNAVIIEAPLSMKSSDVIYSAFPGCILESRVFDLFPIFD